MPVEPSRIIHLAETVSTNIDALNLAARGETGPLWVAADRQTGGKGRSGRAWTSLEGNLHASFLKYFDVPAAVLPQISLVAGVATITAIRAAIALARPARLRLKWPNDILLDGAKIAGLLVESTRVAGLDGFAVVIGVGINVAGAPSISGRATADLHALMRPGLNRTGLLAALDHCIQSTIDTWENGANFETIRAEWTALAGELGEPITIQSHHGAVSGFYGGLDETGGLRLRLPDGKLQSFSWGDVTLASEASPGSAGQEQGRE